MNKISTAMAILAMFLATAATANVVSTVNNLTILKMSNGEVLNIESTARAGDPILTTLTINGTTYAVYGLRELPNAGPIYAVSY